MRNLLKLFYIFMFVITIQPLFSVHMGEIDHEEHLGDRTIKIKQVVVDFNEQVPLDLSNIDTFLVDNLTEKLNSRINRINTIDNYAKKNIEIYFRNINTQNNLSASCIAMKELGYSKYSSEEPSILLQNCGNTLQDIKDSTDNKRNEYHGSGLL